MRAYLLLCAIFAALALSSTVGARDPVQPGGESSGASSTDADGRHYTNKSYSTNHGPDRLEEIQTGERGYKGGCALMGNMCPEYSVEDQAEAEETRRKLRKRLEEFTGTGSGGRRVP